MPPAPPTDRDAPAVDAPAPSVTFGQALGPILALLGLVVYGLILRPQVFGQPAFPLEVVFVLAATVAVTELLVLGHRWDAILATIVAKLARALPAFFIFFAIGLIIGSWMVCGTIPMLVYYGLQLVHPSVLYLSAFLVPAVFSTLTGTSWGSAGTVGVVVIGIAGAMGGHLGITAGAVVGGAFFGDKLSPLSDTTNIAALAADVTVYEHIGSMLWTTVPSALIACATFAVLGVTVPPAITAGSLESLRPFMDALDSIFAFSPLLLIPPALVLAGSVTRKPTVPTLVVSALSACGLALALQPFTLADVMQSLYRGFDTSMAPWATGVTDQVTTLLDRGGLYALIDAIVIAMMVFVFIGAMEHVRAIDTVVNRAFRFAQTRRATVLSTLAAAGVTNALTSNQYATSFIVADAFKAKYDALGISRRVLSRSLEDTGTMIESVVPWTPTAVFMVATLGVPFAAYAPWQIFSLANLAVAPLLAILGVALFPADPPRTALADVADA
ncbi:Na+/H+ antiporter NhaC family protein [Rubrivirga sp.]|uniref:Na+/H+ antiporter NhaC family protein n=1 Tax=Rubrivirga sp. TaxID=1885344 RepID=UPI003B51B74F